MHDPTDPTDPPPNLARWGGLVTLCVLLALAGAIVYGVATR